MMDKALIKPPKLREGSTIAIISPSSGLYPSYPGIYELGLKHLKEKFGFEIIELPTARMDRKALYDHPRLRADDINQAFANPEIDGIVTSIGGYESVRILPYLDIPLILSHPKFIMGLSDATTFLSYLNMQGMITFYGPSLMAGLAQLDHLPTETEEHLKAILLGDHYPYEYRPYPRWTNGYKDWRVEETLGQCTDFFPNQGWNALQGRSETQGYLWGGCIEVLEFLKGTDYWPDQSFWQDKILFFETSEEKPEPSRVGYMLRNYGMQGIWNQVRGVLFGRAKDYTDQEKAELNDIIQGVIREEFNAPDIPVLTELDFGHTDPKLILPLGGLVAVDPVAKTIRLAENPFDTESSSCF